jgi:ABC-2 type transport system ATP-binding protein
MIEVRDITKYFGARAAIRELNFDIRPGEVVGFVGLNGAGKTTTLKILGCVLLPSSGQVRVDGIEVTAEPHEVRRKIGFLPDVPPLYDEMTVGAYLAFAARLRGITGRDTPARVQESEDKLALRDVHGEIIGTLSYGFRQRVGVAQALVHRPRLLILDEPAAGLDPVQIVEMRNLIQRLRGEHTVLISSHFLAEVSQTCDRLLVIQAGEIVAQGTEEEIAAALGTPGEIEVALRGPAATALEVARQVPGVLDAQLTHSAAQEILLKIRAREDCRPEIARALVLAGHFAPGVHLHRTDPTREVVMSAALLIARRELGSYLRTMNGYIIAAAVLLVDGILWNAFALGAQQDKHSAEVLSDFFYFSSGTTMIAAVFLSMRLVAEERQNGTLVLLTSSPVRDREIILGKFLSALAFLAMVTLATAFMPALIMVNGKLSIGQVAAGYLGLLLLGSAALAIGTLGSALARSQVLAAIISGAMLVGLIVVWLLAAVSERPLNDVFLALALWGRHFPPFQAGVINLRDVAYYLLVTYFALFAATRVLEARRWQ